MAVAAIGLLAAPTQNPTAATTLPRRMSPRPILLSFLAVAISVSAMSPIDWAVSEAYTSEGICESPWNRGFFA